MTKFMSNFIPLSMAAVYVHMDMPLSETSLGRCLVSPT